MSLLWWKLLRLFAWFLWHWERCRVKWKSCHIPVWDADIPSTCRFMSGGCPTSTVPTYFNKVSLLCPYLIQEFLWCKRGLSKPCNWVNRVTLLVENVKNFSLFVIKRCLMYQQEGSGQDCLQTLHKKKTEENSVTNGKQHVFPSNPLVKWSGCWLHLLIHHNSFLSPWSYGWGLQC